MDDLHDVLMITYNRPAYTRLALARLLESADSSMRVWVWHNGDDHETLEVVRGMSGHPRFHHLEVSRENRRLRDPTNWFWEASDGVYLSKVDDDCLEPDGWGQTLRQVCRDNTGIGVVGAWRFYEDDFVPELARRKIVALRGGHQLMANCWVQGSGYVMQRSVVDELGLIQADESFSSYCIRAALAGWSNGWLYPFLHEEHMDDPRSEFCQIRTDEEFKVQRPLSAIRDSVETLDQWAARIQHMAYMAQKASPDPKQHVGWRRRVKRVNKRLGRAFGRGEEWRRA